MNLIDKIIRLIALAKSEMKVLEDKDALDVLELYPQWQSGKNYVVGDRVKYDGKLWKVLQGHTSQESWKPDVAASLFVQVQIESEQGTNAWLSVTLNEGKNREIRKLMKSIGLEVARLIRLSYGPFQLGSLKKGEVKEIPQKVLREQLGGKFQL